MSENKNAEADEAKKSLKDEVKCAIESGEAVKEAVARIACNATKNALKKRKVTADNVKTVANNVISSAVEAAEETGGGIKDVAVGAFEGTQKGVAEALKKTKTFLNEDVAKTREELKAIEELFSESVLNIASRSGEVAKDILTGLAKQTGEIGKTSVDAAKGAVSGFLKGVAEALEKDKDK